MKKKLINLIAVFAISPQIVNAENLDVHGRPMTYAETSKLSYLNFVGHVGVEYSNGIYNMLPSKSSSKTSYGTDNYLHYSAKSSFTDHPQYWGARYATINSPTASKALINLGMQVGIDYTKNFHLMFVKNPSIVKDARTKQNVPKRGEHRCDTFVEKVLQAGGKSSVWYYTPSHVFNSLPNKR